MSCVKRLGLIVLTAALIAAAPLTPAVGRESATSTAPGAGTLVTAPLPYDVQVWPDGEPGYLLLIAAVEVPTSTPLPATVRMAAPEGAEIVWTGEIMSGGPEGDVRRDFRVVAGSLEGTSVEFTLTQSRQAQYEAVLGPLPVSGGSVRSSVRWRQTEPASTLQFSVRLPANISDVAITPQPVGEVQRSPEGETLYTLPLIESPTRESAVSVAYRQGGAVPDGGTGDGTLRTGTVFGLLLALLAVAATALVVALRRQRSSPS